MPDSTLSPNEAIKMLGEFSGSHQGHEGYDVGLEDWGFSLYCESCNALEMLCVEGLKEAMGKELSERRYVGF